jgi:hypothetical protein
VNNRIVKWLTLLVAAFFAAPLVFGQGGRLHWNVMDAGAKPNGLSDASKAFQTALDEAGKAGGGIVDVPAGRYRLDAGLSIPANVTLEGVFRSLPTATPNALTNLSGSALLAYPGRGSTNGPALIRLAGDNASFSGIAIVYPEWKQSDVPPIPYPPCVEARDVEGVSVQNCLLINPYEGIRLVHAARHLVRNVAGYPSMRGLSVDECYDIGRIENVHFWPFGVIYEADNPYCKWINTHGVAFELARTDWHYVLNTFCFGYGIGYKFSQSKHGSANGNFLGLGADSCERAVVVEQAQPAGLLISNGEFVGRWSSGNSVCLEIGPDVEGPVSLVNCSFWGPVDRCVWMRSAAGQFTASACHFINWDVRGAGSPAIQLDAGRAIVQGCSFSEDHLQVEIASEVRSAILTANQAPGGFHVENHAGPRVQSGLNEADSVSWTPTALAHYRIEFGTPGDARYLRGWHGVEKGTRPFRWSMPVSRLTLPVAPDQNYTLTLEFNAPQAALSPKAGVYLNGTPIAALNNSGIVTAAIPKLGTDVARLEIRVEGWTPQTTDRNSRDTRTLGIQAFRLTMKSSSAGPSLFNANTGVWLEPAKTTK